MLWVGALLCGTLATCPLLADDPPAADRGTPEAVARAYLQACEKADSTAASAFLDPKTDAAARAAQQDMPPEFSLDQFLTEMMLIPFPNRQSVKYAPGELVVEGETARMSVVATVTLPQTLVLRKGADGQWIVDLRQSIIASIGLAEPFLLRAREQAEQSSCQSNLRQLALGVLMWAQDHDEVLPPAENWMTELEPYLKNPEIYRCPAAPELECGYAYNLAVAGLNLADIPDPAGAVLFYESTVGMPSTADMGETQPQPGRHEGGNNLAYVDGHVKWVADAEQPPEE
jgi:prepilin-type processing-associated H-X9-DG protein